MARLHLGINTCFAVKRWPEPEQWLDIVREELGWNCSCLRIWLYLESGATVSRSRKRLPILHFRAVYHWFFASILGIHVPCIQARQVMIILPGLLSPGLTRQ